MGIKENIGKIIEELPEDVILEAAAKTRSVEEIKESISAGVEIIGENYVNEAEEKYNELKGKVKIHCIGHIQSNKVKKAVEIFDMIETVDSLKIAKLIDKYSNKKYPILIEINSGKEENKSGVLPEKAIEMIENISKLSNLKVMGLMTMGKTGNEEECFKLTKNLFDKIKKIHLPNVEMKYLSMGMSDSYKKAIDNGANIVRIGSRIFGPR